MENRFQRDFRDVRVHTNARAAGSARDLDARAYSLGNDIVFSAGEYAPEHERGRQLLAHELTHVVQADISRPWMNDIVSRPADPHEREATRVARAVGRGLAAGPIREPTSAAISREGGDNERDAPSPEFLEMRGEAMARAGAYPQHWRSVLFGQCEEAQLEVLHQGLTAAIASVDAALAQMQEARPSAAVRERIQELFISYSAERYRRLRGRLRDIHGVLQRARKGEIEFHCEGRDCRPSYNGYVLRHRPDTIYLCPGAFAADIATEWTLIHEAAHLAGVVSQEREAYSVIGNCQPLGTLNPEEMADAYVVFVFCLTGRLT